MALTLLLAFAATASADLDLCTAGSGAGECKNPQGVAVDPSSGHAYVADYANNRIDVFDSTGAFLFAFGWGVADGTSAEPQTCTTTCFKGLEGGGAGQFSKAAQIAVDPAAPHDVYVSGQYRVQRFSSAGEFIAAWGGGVISGGAAGKGDLASGSTMVTNVVTTKKTFYPGQAISGAGIPAGSVIAAVGPGTITLSQAATATATGVALSAPEGAGNIAVNELQSFDPGGPGSEAGFRFRTPAPSNSEDVSDFNKPLLTPSSSAAEVQKALEELSNIDPGDVAVTGSVGGPFTIEFKGRYADTDVVPLQIPGSGNPGPKGSTLRNGASAAEICPAALAGVCAAGVEGGGEGRFGEAGGRVAVGPGGGVYVGDSQFVEFNGQFSTYAARVEKFEPSGAFVEEVALPGTERISGLAVDSGGDFYVVKEPLKVEKYDPSGALLDTIALENVRAVAVDGADHLFAGHTEKNGVWKVVSEFDPAGTIVRRFGYGSIEESLSGLAPSPAAAGDLIGSEAGYDRVRYLSLPAAGPLPCCVQVQPGNVKATLKGGVNPEGKAATYHFDYLTEADFQANFKATGEGFTGPKPFAFTPESASVGSDFTLHDAEAQIGCPDPTNPPQASCLKYSTAYRYRLVAKGEDGENSFEGSFKTKPPFEITETYATDVGTDAARINATVNPSGIQTSAYFEYVDDASYQADVEAGGDGFAEASKTPDVDNGAPAIDLGSGEAAKTVSAQLSSLPHGATFHYRIAVSDPFASEAGPTHAFTVFALPKAPANACPNAGFRVGPSALLPECRAYEMVSPVDKNGGDIKVLATTRGYPSRLDQSADDGNGFAYSSVTAFAGALSSPWTSQYQATREPGVGWSTKPISPPRESQSIDLGINIKFDVQYKAFAPDLSSGWLIQDTDPPLEPCAQEGFFNLYRRDNGGGYEALTTVKPSNQTPGLYVPELQGLSTDGTHAIFRANAKLTTNASSVKGLYQLYEHVAGEGCGELRLVSALPDGSAPKLQSTAGARGKNLPGESRDNTVARAVSADGSRIFWSSGEIGSGALYVRIDGKETIEITPGGSQFRTAASDGSKVIYSVGGNLYEAQIAPGSSVSTLIAGGFEGLAGASEDASRVYFVSTETLGGEGEAGEPNLYLHEAGGATSLVATLYPGNGSLPEGDLNRGFDLAGFAVGRMEPIANGVRVTPDGAHLAFVSAGSPTGYDNTDAVDGEPDLEVYLYDMASGKVACVSCNPSGGRPTGRGFGDEQFRRVSAQMPPGENQSFAPRVLSDDGNRLFFESFEALLPRDTNGKADVYQWSRASGQAQCDERGAELFVPASGGCLSLISSGQSPTDSEIADATPDGSDVFIRTGSSLLPQDPGQVDLYDARVNGGMPQPPAQPAACEGEACQGPLAPPDDATPASSAFHGAGNVKAPVVCKKGQVKKKGRCVKPKKHKHAAKKHKQQKKADNKRRAGR